MESKSPQSKGGAATGAILRKNAIEKYMINPNYCLFCHSIILIKDGQKPADVRVKKFCGHSCSAKFSNSKRWANRQKEEKPKRTPRTPITIIDRYKNLTKVELFGKSKNWQSARSQICKHAKAVKPLKSPCHNCGYSHHTELCHIKSVSSFPDDSLIEEINEEANLVYLCPNCHWEFDHQLLTLIELI